MSHAAEPAEVIIHLIWIKPFQLMWLAYPEQMQVGYCCLANIGQLLQFIDLCASLRFFHGVLVCSGGLSLKLIL